MVWFGRLLLAFTVLFPLGACAYSDVQSAFAPPTVVSTPMSVPTRPALDGTATPEVCNLSGPLRLGAVVSLTGSAQNYGRSIQRGIDLAVREINESDFITPAAELVVLYEDDNTDPDDTAAAFTRLIEEEEVLGLLGPTLSTNAFTANPIAQKAGVPVVATSNTAAGIPEIGSYIFRASLPEISVVPNTLNTVRTAFSADTVFIVYDRDDSFTLSGYEVMTDAAEQQGVEIIGNAGFSHDARHFDDIIEEIQATDPDLIMVSALIDQAVGFLKELREAGITTPVMGGNGFNSPALSALAGSAAEGAISGAAWSPDNDSPENRAFVEAYRTLYNEAPDQFAAQAYTGVYLYAHTFRNGCSTVRADIRNGLANMRLVSTPLGKFSFTTDRNPLHAPVVLIVEEGEQVVFQPTE